MKYQHILNGVLLYETNDASAFTLYLLTDKRANQAKHSALNNLLDNNKGYICDMKTNSYLLIHSKL